MYVFNSGFKVGQTLNSFSEDEVKNEPMLFSCDIENAYHKGGPITKNFLEVFFGDSLFLETKGYCVDSRVHMLMPNWWPCIPGWHHDDVPRSTENGQPNYKSPEYFSKHCLALVNGDICPTEFIKGKVELPDFSDKIYKHWNTLIEEKIKLKEIEKFQIPSNKLIHFTCNDFHRGTKCVEKGWRWFGRISYNAGYEQGRPHYNEVRNQVNVYMDTPEEGW